MTDFVFNIAKGREHEFWANVDGNSPATSGLVIVPLSASGTPAQGQDLDDLNAVLTSGFFTEETANWDRTILDDTHLAATDYDANDTDNRGDYSVPQRSLGSPAGGTLTGLLICYAPDTGGADSTFIPISHHDFAKTGDGSEVLLAAGNAIQAS